MSELLIWYFTLQLFALAGLSLAFVGLRNLPSRGYAVAKALGLLLTGVLFWWGSLLHFWANEVGAVLLCAIIVAGVGLALVRGRWQEWKDWWQDRWQFAVTAELLFLGLLLLWAVIRAQQPQIETAGGEKWMEIAFLNSVLRSPFMPPHDPWLSGYSISYYYLGYVLLGIVTRLSSVPAAVAFNLASAGWFALAGVGAYGVVYDLLDGRDPVRALGGPLLLLITGNGEGLLEVLHARGLFPETFWRWLDIRSINTAPQPPFSWIPTRYFWWWQASRVIHDYVPGGGDQEVIDEFPAFSFVLGDLHPHVLGLPFVLVVVALALNFYRRPVDPAQRWGFGELFRRAVLDREWQVGALLIGSGLLLGALGFLNTWDFPIYWALLVIAWVMGGSEVNRPGLWARILRVMPDAAGLGVLSVLLYLPFWVGLRSQAGGILPNFFNATAPQQFVVVFLPFLVPIVALIVAVGMRYRISGLKAVGWGLGLLLGIFVVGSLAGLLIGYPLVMALLQQMPMDGLNLGTGAFRDALMARLLDPLTAWIWVAWVLATGALAIFLVLEHQDGRRQNEAPLESGEGFALLLALVGLLLVLAPELVFLKDLFLIRMNTVFKFYFQAWVLLSLASAWWLGQSRISSKVWWRAAAWVCIAAGLVYLPLAANKRAEEHGRPWTLDGSAGLALTDPEDLAAIEWLNANVSGNPVILEAPGDQHRSYIYEGRVSAFTGLPTVLGWSGHENQWRGNYEEQSRREADLNLFFTSADVATTKSILARYGVAYIYVGPLETERYTPAMLSVLNQMYPIVYQNSLVTIYRVEP